MKAIFTIVGSARSRHISPCIAADRDWITKKNQKAKHSMSNPARRRKLPGGVFFCRCASYSLCLPVCRIPMETHERRNTIETVFLRRRSKFHGNVYPPSEPIPYQQPTKRQRAQRSSANVQHLLALEAPVTTRCDLWLADACNTNLAGGTACENLCSMPRKTGARYPCTQPMEGPLVVSRLFLLGSVRRSLRAGAIRSECQTSKARFLCSRQCPTLTLWTRGLCRAASFMSP